MNSNDTDKKIRPDAAGLGIAVSLISSCGGWGAAKDGKAWDEVLSSLCKALQKSEKEMDLLSIWLANAYIDIDLLPKIESGAMNPPTPEDIREAARKAIEKEMEEICLKK